MKSNRERIRAYLQKMEVGDFVNIGKLATDLGICRQSVSNNFKKMGNDTIFLDFNIKKFGNSLILVKVRKEY